MTVTDADPKTEPSPREDDPRDGEYQHDEPRQGSQGGEDRKDRHDAKSANGSPASPEESEDSENSSESKEPETRKRAKGIAGGVGIFLVLAIYFAWIGSEMGSHAISGTFEMWAIFGAIFLGVVALVAGGAISQKVSGGKHD